MIIGFSDAQPLVGDLNLLVEESVPMVRSVGHDPDALGRFNRLAGLEHPVEFDTNALHYGGVNLFSIWWIVGGIRQNVGQQFRWDRDSKADRNASVFGVLAKDVDVRKARDRMAVANYPDQGCVEAIDVIDPGWGQPGPNATPGHQDLLASFSRREDDFPPLEVLA
jgi:hypothetical protein